MIGIQLLRYSGLSSPLLLVRRVRLNFDEYSTMGTRPIKDVLAEWVSFETGVFDEGLGLGTSSLRIQF